MFDVTTLIRPNIGRLIPYSCARDEYTGLDAIFLDANENNVGSAVNVPYALELNRYPNPKADAFREQYGIYRGVAKENIIIGVGSDEVIDLTIRAFCIPGKDNILINPPTYGMYKVTAEVNDVEVKEVALTDEFQIDVQTVLGTVDNNTKVIIFCSPNNPTGNLLRTEDILDICRNVSCLVIVDEAYIDFSQRESLSGYISRFPNLFVLQTVSKAWGLAGLRVGIGIANPEIINVLMKIKAPYNMNMLSVYLAAEGLQNISIVNTMCEKTVKERARVMREVAQLGCVKKVYPSDANFFLFQVVNANATYQALANKRIIIRNRSTFQKCEGCLRMTIGTKEENDLCLKALKNLSNNAS